MLFFFYLYGDHRALHVLTHSFPTRRSSVLLEGIAADGEGGFWLASEGYRSRMVMHGLVHVDAEGAIDRQIAFPAALLAVEKRWGAEGVAKIGNTLWIAIQRQWKDDPENTVKLVAYNLDTKE